LFSVTDSEQIPAKVAFTTIYCCVIASCCF